MKKKEALFFLAVHNKLGCEFRRLGKLFEKDHLDNTVSVVAKLEDNGIKAELRSRTLSALDRLLGSLIDIPAAYLEERASTIRALARKRL